MTKVSDMLYHLGGLPVLTGVPFCKDSKYYFVDARNGSDGNHGLTPDKPLATIITAEDRCVANRHDTVFIIGTGTAINMTAAITWAKSYTHMIGICAPTHVAQRARIANEAAVTDLSPLFNVTASGCMFKNFYCFQGVDDAASLINWQVGGGRHYFENVHFAGNGHATCAVDGSAALRLTGSDGENMFRNCTIGVDTNMSQATGVRCLALSGGTPRNIFESCQFITYASSSGVMFVEWENLSAVDRYILFDRCRFINTGSSTMAQAFSIPASVPTHRRAFLHDCAGYGFTDWEASNRGVLYISGGTHTSGGYSALFQASVVT